ncbi:MAG TPA: alpha/beta fold hydrolase [Solirubrobacteraceae bacterium]
MPRVAVAGSELHYERRGRGPALLLIQGMGANGTHWGEPFLGELERDFELILYDHRGIGRSAPLKGGTITVASLAGDALGLLDALGIGDAHVLGISMGGMVAQELALAAPQRVRSLILGATSCGGTQARATAPEVVSRLTTVALSRDRELMLRTGFELVVSRRHAAQPAHFAEFVEAAKQFPATLPVLLAQKGAADGHDAYSRLRSLRVPTLVIHGTADELLASINGDLVASLIPGARLELLEGVGHLFFWEQPRRSAELVRGFALDARVLSNA